MMAIKAGDRHLWCRKSKDGRWVRMGRDTLNRAVFRCSGCGKHKFGRVGAA